MHRTAVRLTLLSLGLALANSANAEYVWIAPSATGTLEVRYGELLPAGHDHAGHAHESTADAAPALATILPTPSVRGVTGDQRRFRSAGEVGQISGTSNGDVRLAQQALANGKTIALSYDARWGRTTTTPAQGKFLELVPTRANGNTFVLQMDGKTFANAPVQLESKAGGWSRWYRTDAQGALTIDTPWPGLYVMSVGRRDLQPGVIDGRPYTAMQHAATLSFVVDGVVDSPKRKR